MSAGRALNIGWRVLLIWFCFVVFGADLIGNVLFAVTLLQRGDIYAAVLFVLYFGGMGVACFRFRDEIGSDFHWLVKTVTGQELRDLVLKVIELKSGLRLREVVETATRARIACARVEAPEAIGSSNTPAIAKASWAERA